ncbi:MAG: hypothetical protein NT096_09915 [Proteobacteria bacterium]|nr:hypothetical protein [Pseudomonadota bacterium]
MNKIMPMEIDNFPLSGIVPGSIFTFTPRIAREVVHADCGMKKR